MSIRFLWFYLAKALMKVNTQDKELINLAQKLIKKRKGRYSTVAAAFRTTDHKFFFGVNVEHIHSSPCSMCAEYSAIGQMQSDDDYEVELIVALRADGTILSPCGKCREMLRQFGNPYVILKEKNDFFKVRLDKLIPYRELNK